MEAILELVNGKQKRGYGGAERRNRGGGEPAREAGNDGGGPARGGGGGGPKRGNDGGGPARGGGGGGPNRGNDGGGPARGGGGGGPNRGNDGGGPARGGGGGEPNRRNNTVSLARDSGDTIEIEWIQLENLIREKDDALRRVDELEQDIASQPSTNIRLDALQLRQLLNELRHTQRTDANLVKLEYNKRIASFEKREREYQMGIGFLTIALGISLYKVVGYWRESL